VSSFVDVIMGLSLGKNLHTINCSYLGSSMIVFQRIGVRHQPSLVLIFGKKFNNVHGDVIYHIMFLMHLRLSLLFIPGYILLIEARPIIDLMFTARNL
jgi:hypothetical protein